MAHVEIHNQVTNQNGSPAIYSDVIANRPIPGIPGRLFVSTDTLVIYRDTGSVWVLIGGGGGGGVASVNGNEGILVINADPANPVVRLGSPIMNDPLIQIDTQRFIAVNNNGFLQFGDFSTFGMQISQNKLEFQNAADITDIDGSNLTIQDGSSIPAFSANKNNLLFNLGGGQQSTMDANNVRLQNGTVLQDYHINTNNQVFATMTGSIPGNMRGVIQNLSGGAGAAAAWTVKNDVNSILQFVMFGSASDPGVNNTSMVRATGGARLAFHNDANFFSFGSTAAFDAPIVSLQNVAGSNRWQFTGGQALSAAVDDGFTVQVRGNQSVSLSDPANVFVHFDERNIDIKDNGSQASFHANAGGWSIINRVDINQFTGATFGGFAANNNTTGDASGMIPTGFSVSNLAGKNSGLTAIHGTVNLAIAPFATFDIGGSISTDNCSNPGNNNVAVKFGQITPGAVVVDTTRSLTISYNGVVYKLIVSV